MADPMDETVEKDLKKQRKWTDPYANSVDPPGLEGTGLGENDEEFIEFERGEEKEEERKDSDSYSEDSFQEPSEVKPTERKAKSTDSEEATDE
jgi:hypothetical protein